MTLKIDGRKISAQIKDEVKARTQQLKAEGLTPVLAVIQVGSDPASTLYVGNKKKACAYTGIESRAFELPENTTQDELLALIAKLNTDPQVNGILVQLPLPEHINEKCVIEAIDPKKDVDGFHPMNVGALVTGEEGFVSCTPAGIIQLLRRSGIKTDGRECVIVGRSNIVGKPMAILMLRENATVTICHSHTKDLAAVCRRADILITAIGKPKFFTREFIKPGAVVIDVGIHKLAPKTFCGDCDHDDIDEIVSAVTPVPGGVGPMTVAMLMVNCVKALEMQHGIHE